MMAPEFSVTVNDSQQNLNNNAARFGAFSRQNCPTSTKTVDDANILRKSYSNQPSNDDSDPSMMTMKSLTTGNNSEHRSTSTVIEQMVQSLKEMKTSSNSSLSQPDSLESNGNEENGTSCYKAKSKSPNGTAKNVLNAYSKANAANNRLFLGGLNPMTTEKDLITYFSKYGTIEDVLVVRYSDTLASRRFGFISFSKKEVIDEIVEMCAENDGKVEIDNFKVQIKYAIPVDQIDSRNPFNKKKVFVGGISPAMTEKHLTAYFERFGCITSCQIQRNHNNNQQRGFGFVIFESEDAAATVIHCQYHFFSNTRVECKLALPTNSLRLLKKFRTIISEKEQLESSLIMHKAAMERSQLVDLLELFLKAQKMQQNDQHQ